MRRYESRAGAGPMQTSSSAKRTCSDSRSASEYTATVAIPSSRQARMTRSAISPRLAIKTFLNMFKHVGASSRRQVEGPGERLIRRRDLGELAVRRRVDTGGAQRELARISRVEERALVRDHPVFVPLHQRLVERLHAVRHRAGRDQVGD